MPNAIHLVAEATNSVPSDRFLPREKGSTAKARMSVKSQSNESAAMVSSASRPLCLRMRADIIANRQSYQGRDYWVLKDPISLKFYRFEDEEYALLKMLDGRLSPDQIKRRFDYEFAPQKITIQELFQFVGMLYRSCLLISDGANQGFELKKRGEQNRKRERRSALTNILAIRFKGFDPDRILSWMNGFTWWFFTWPCFVLVLIAGLSAACLLLTNFETLQSRLPSMGDFFTAKNWIWLAIVLAVTKVFHEFGHGLACKRFGSQCHEMGLMLLVLTPCLYCNVSDSWTLPSKWKRAFIAAAGMYVELVLATLATFIWWFSNPGLVNQLALNVIFVCSISTLLFNANPLLRYDGYYILSDLLEIPNLRQKATNVLQRTAGNWFLGMQSKFDPFMPAKRKWAFMLYAVAAALYRWLITLAIFWFVYELLEPYGLKIVGQAIAMMAIYGLIGIPLVQLYRFFSVPGRLGSVKGIRVAISCGILIAVVVGVLFIPIPRHVYCSFYVQPQDTEPLYVNVPGTLASIEAEANERIQAGQPIISLVSFELEQQLLDMQSKVQLAEKKLSTILFASQIDDEENRMATRLDPARAELAAAQRQLSQRQLDVPKLEVKAPVDGLLLAPPRVTPTPSKEEQLEGWDGTPLDAKNIGAYLDQKTMICQIVPDPDQLEAVLAIDQQEIEFIRKGQTVELLIKQTPCATLFSMTDRISPTKMAVVPKQLSSKYGGDILTTTDKEGQDVPQSTHYLVSVALNHVGGELVTGCTGTAKIQTGSQTVGQRIWRLMMQTFRFEL